jgi:hypothetical protein
MYQSRMILPGGVTLRIESPKEPRIRNGSEQMVLVPVRVIERALTKAKIEYDRVAAQHGQERPPRHECWAEFEALCSLSVPGHHVEVEAALVAVEKALRAERARSAQLALELRRARDERSTRL